MQTAEWTAIVSAVSAAVQAIGAVGAIVYSGKLARDSAKREIAASMASAARELDADRRAIERADLAEKRAKEAQERAQIEAHNGPIDRALEAAANAEADFEQAWIAMTTMAQRGDTSHVPINGTNAQAVFQEMKGQLLEAAPNARTAAAIRALVDSSQAYSTAMSQPSSEWVRILRGRLDTIAQNREALLQCRRPDASSSGSLPL